MVLCIKLVHYDHIPSPYGPRPPALSERGVELSAWCCCNNRQIRSRLARAVFLAWCRALPCCPSFLSEDALVYVKQPRWHVVRWLLSTDHGEEATQYLKAFIGEHYAQSDKSMFKALWESYNKCQFVDDEGPVTSQSHLHLTLTRTTGDVLFYRNKQGVATRRLAEH